MLLVHDQTPKLEDCLPPMPIIVGAPRSGTTLLRFMLDSHPDLAIPPETGFLTLKFRRWLRGDRLRRKFFQRVISYPESAPFWADFEIDAEVFWTALTRINPFTVADGYRAFYKLYAERFGKSRWGDKTPYYCLELDRIRRVLPEARFIHLIRDGRDVAMSLRKMWFSPGPEVEVQAAYWKKFVGAGRRAGLGRTDYIEVRYEDLILNTQHTLERICNFIGISYDKAMLNYHTRTPWRLQEHKGRVSNGRLVLSQEQRLLQQARTKQPPDASLVFAWKHTMDANEREKFDRVAGDLLKELQYETR